VAFQLPEQLPTTVAELDELLNQARAEIQEIQRRDEEGEVLTQDDVDELNRLLDAVDQVSAAKAEAVAAEKAAKAEAEAKEKERRKAVDAALRRAKKVTEVKAKPEPVAEEPETEEPEAEDGEGEAEESEQPVEEAEEPDEATPNVPAVPEDTKPVPVAAAAKPTNGRRPVRYDGLGRSDDVPATREPGWEMDPSCPGYRPGMGRIGFAELGRAIDSVKPGSRSRNRPNKFSPNAIYSAQVLARLARDMETAADAHALYAAINAATDQKALPGGSLVAAGGWCAPSEQLYNFCDVPNATDLISLPEIAINRGGIRWPIEPDLTAIFNDFEWFYTEPQLEAVDSGGDPTAQKNCVDIPCPEEFEEIRLNALGYCVEAGILQTQGWPELITWFMEQLAQEHLRALSKRTIIDLVAGSTHISINPNYTFGAVPALLNSLAMVATNLRLQKGLARDTIIEGVAPSWLAEVMRADLAMQEGVSNKAVTDAEVLGWFAARNIALQLVGDWQTRDAGTPGDLTMGVWPAEMDILLYPAGTWFRSMSNVIELGVMYPKEQLAVNRYTRFFVEDALAVGKRCYQSQVVTVPICVSGALSERVSVACGPYTGVREAGSLTVPSTFQPGGDWS